MYRSKWSKLCIEDRTNTQTLYIFLADAVFHKTLCLSGEIRVISPHHVVMLMMTYELMKQSCKVHSDSTSQNEHRHLRLIHRRLASPGPGDHPTEFSLPVSPSQNVRPNHAKLDQDHSARRLRPTDRSIAQTAQLGLLALTDRDDSAPLQTWTNLVRIRSHGCKKTWDPTAPH